MSEYTIRGSCPRYILYKGGTEVDRASDMGAIMLSVAHKLQPGDGIRWETDRVTPGTRISKTTVTITALHRSDELLPEDLTALLYQLDEGNAVGLETARATAAVPDEAVRDELLALGNDGDFFDIADWDEWHGTQRDDDESEQ
jgi:hypothetical protein